MVGGLIRQRAHQTFEGIRQRTRYQMVEKRYVWVVDWDTEVISSNS